VWDRKLVGRRRFAIQTDGGLVPLDRFQTAAKWWRVEMGKTSVFCQRQDSRDRREPGSPINEKDFRRRDVSSPLCAATIGNPHCVLAAEISAKLAHEFRPWPGSFIEFPAQDHVQ